MKRLNLWAACALTIALAACGRPVPQQAPPGENPGSGDPSAVAPAAPGYGKLKVRKVYDYVGDRAGTPWASFELNGDYNYPEPILGNWPVRVTPVDAGGNPTGPAVDTTTLQEMSPTDGRYLELPIGRYRVEELTPVYAAGGQWETTGANVTQGGTTTSAGKTTSVVVDVIEGTDGATATVARFFNACRVNGQAQRVPAASVADVRADGWACKPNFGGQALTLKGNVFRSPAAGGSPVNGARVSVTVGGATKGDTTGPDGRFEVPFDDTAGASTFTVSVTPPPASSIGAATYADVPLSAYASPYGAANELNIYLIAPPSARLPGSPLRQGNIEGLLTDGGSPAASSNPLGRRVSDPTYGLEREVKTDQATFRAAPTRARATRESVLTPGS